MRNLAVLTLVAAGLAAASLAAAHLHGAEDASAASAAQTRHDAAAAGSAAHATPADRKAERKLLGQAAEIGASTASLQNWLDELDQLTIEAGAVFSLHQWSGARAEENGWRQDEETLSLVGSALLQNAVQAGLKVGERHRHAALPDHMAPGYDVAYVPDEQDLMLYNPHDFPIDCRVFYTDGAASVGLFGDPGADWEPVAAVAVEEIFPAGSIRVVDYGQGTQTRTRPGRDGRMIKVYAEDADGGRELLYKDYYPPEPMVIFEAPASEAEDTRSDPFVPE